MVLKDADFVSECVVSILFYSSVLFPIIVIYISISLFYDLVLLKHPNVPSVGSIKDNLIWSHLLRSVLNGQTHDTLRQVQSLCVIRLPGTLSVLK